MNITDKKPYLLDFPKHGDDRGWLTVIENDSDIPFEMKRIFYIYGSDSNVVRGRHANIKSEFVLVNVAGSCKVKVTDGYGYDHVFVMDRPNLGVYIPKMYWKEMYDFSENSVLLCISSEKYDSSEYLRDYSEYKKIVKPDNIFQ